MIATLFVQTRWVSFQICCWQRLKVPQCFSTWTTFRASAQRLRQAALELGRPGLNVLSAMDCWVPSWAAVAVVCTYLYSVPPFRTKRLGIWANVTIAIPRDPCFAMDLIAPGVREAMQGGHQGALARVTSSGIIAAGMAVTVSPAEVPIEAAG